MLRFKVQESGSDKRRVWEGYTKISQSTEIYERNGVTELEIYVYDMWNELER